MKKVLFTLIVALAFCGSALAKYAEPHWPNINQHLFSYSSTIVATVAIDSRIVSTEANFADFEIAAFVGEDDYRGHGFMTYHKEEGDPLPIVEFEIYYGPLDNENEQPLPVYFKLYDHSSQKLYEYCIPNMDIVTQIDYTNGYVFDDNMVLLSFFTAFKKEIARYTDNGGYYFIASPIGEVNPEVVTNMLDNNYDLYYFDQSQELEWINYNGDENLGYEGHFNLEPGKGYLYANSENITLTFIGEAYNGDGIVALVKDDAAYFAGWNLVGNPFARTAYITKPFYTMNEDGSEVIAGDGNSVQAMEGIFVIADTDGETMTFSTTEPAQNRGQIVLNVSQEHDATIDRAIVRFGQEEALPKFMLNQNSTKVYISKDSNDYSVVRSNKNDRLFVCFQPFQDGTYTISVNADNLFVSYLHLIDRELGEDINLLQTPSYTFEARTTDDPNRFELVFRTGLSLFGDLFVKEGGDSFSFCSGGNWIINNEGDAILQVVDVNGQIMSSEEISGCVSKHIEAAPGVYMLRLIKGNDVKVQKVVIK